MLLGICGKSGSGKSFVARSLMQARSNVIHIDIDALDHQANEIKEVKEELIKHFGSEVVKNGVVDRKYLGSIVFNDKEKMNLIMKIKTYYAYKIIDNIIANNPNSLIILDHIRLPEMKYFDMCDLKVLVDIPYEVRKERAIERDHITETQFDLREKGSIDYDKSKFDVILSNTSLKSIDDLRGRVK